MGIIQYLFIFVNTGYNGYMTTERILEPFRGKLDNSTASLHQASCSLCEKTKKQACSCVPPCYLDRCYNNSIIARNKSLFIRIRSCCLDRYARVLL